MTIFANEDPLGIVGTRVTPAPKSLGPDHELSGDDAYGHQVPYHRRDAVYELLRTWDFSRSDAITIVSECCYLVKMDRPHEVMENLRRQGINVTGIYMVLAHLLAGGRPADYAATPSRASYSASRLRVRGNPATGFMVVG